MNTVWRFAMSGNLVFGRKAVAQVGGLVKKLQVARPVIVTDQVLRKLGMVDRVVQTLKEVGLEPIVFDGGQAEPAVEIAEQATHLARTRDADCVIGLGGGSNLDVAKMTANLLAHGGKPADYFGYDKIPGPIRPLIAIPTTAGTGSEVSNSSVLTDTSQKIKVSSLSSWLRPMIAIVDPELTDSCPAHVTAHSGIDALVHAIEGYTARSYQDMLDPDPQLHAYEGAHPLGDLAAEQAIRLIGRHLVHAVQDGTNREARDGMALAASYAGMAFSNCGVGLVHALEYPVGASVHCSHGEGNGLLLPHVLRFIQPIREERLSRIASWLGDDAVSSDPQAGSTLAIDRIVKLIADIGIRSTLTQLGVKPEQLETFSERSFAIKRLMYLSPRSVTRSDLIDILQAAL